MQKLVSLVLCVVLVMSVVLVVGATTGTDVHQFELDLDVSAEALEVYDTPLFRTGNDKIFDVGHPSGKPTSLRVTLRIREGGQKSSGSGTLRIGGNLYPISFEGYLESYELTNGDKVLFGPQDFTVKVRGVAKKSVMALFIDPLNKHYVANLSIGAIGEEDGVAYLSFGEKSARYAEVISLRQPEALEEAAFDELGVIAPMAEMRYTHKGDASTRTLINMIYGPTEIEQASNWVVWMHAHSRDPVEQGNGSGSAQIRVWTNSQAVAYHVQGKGGTAPIIYPENIRIRLALAPGEPQGGINIHTAGPSDAVRLSTSEGLWEYTSLLPYNLDVVLKFLANGYHALTQANVTCSSQRWVHQGTNRTVEMEKSFYIRNGYQVTDYDIYSRLTVPAVTNNKAGGVTAFFDYHEYLYGTGNMVAKTDVRYYVATQNWLYTGYFWTDWTTYTFPVNFLS